MFADESRSLEAGFVDGNAVGTYCPDVEYAPHHMTKVKGEEKITEKNHIGYIGLLQEKHNGFIFLAPDNCKAE